MKNWTE